MKTTKSTFNPLNQVSLFNNIFIFLDNKENNIIKDKDKKKKIFPDFQPSMLEVFKKNTALISTSKLQIDSRLTKKVLIYQINIYKS